MVVVPQADSSGLAAQTLCLRGRAQQTPRWGVHDNDHSLTAPTVPGVYEHAWSGTCVHHTHPWQADKCWPKCDSVHAQFDPQMTVPTESRRTSLSSHPTPTITSTVVRPAPLMPPYGSVTKVYAVTPVTARPFVKTVSCPRRHRTCPAGVKVAPTLGAFGPTKACPTTPTTHNTGCLRPSPCYQHQYLMGIKVEGL